MSRSAAREMLVDGKYLRFQKYEVKIEIQAAEVGHLSKIYAGLEKVFPKGLEPARAPEIEHRCAVVSAADGSSLEFYMNGEKLFDSPSPELFFNMVESRIRMTIAGFAVGKVFLHAGVVGWKGKAIIIPARSFSGKTTLVAELVKKGADYYSDEYAVLDAEGNVEPFPKWLSMRGIIDDFTQLDCPVESFGGVAAVETIPAGLVLIARYRKGRPIPQRWQPKKLSQGMGVMEILPHAIPILNKPKFVLEVLNKLTNRATIVRTVRGEAAEFADLLLGYVEEQAKNFNLLFRQTNKYTGENEKYE